MRNLVFAVALTAVLIGSCVGVGGTIARWAGLDEPDELGDGSRPLSAGVSACLGLAVLLALGGLGMALHLPVALTAGAFVVAGSALLVAHVARSRGHGVTRPLVIVLVAEAVLLGLVATLGAAVGIEFPVNACDDNLAYLPAVLRLLETHASIDPWSLRRLQSFGGQTYLQAIYVGALGHAAIAMVETLFSIVMVWLLITTGLRKASTRAIAVVIAVSLPFFGVPRANTAGVLSPVPLLVALAVLALVARRTMSDAPTRASVVTASAIGLMATAVVVMRTNVAPAAVVLAVVAILTVRAGWRSRVRHLAIAGGVAMAALVPWAAAMWESSGTPFYPLIPGNAVQQIPSLSDPRLHGIGDVAARVWDLLTGDIYPLALVVLLALVIVGWRVLPRSRVTAVIVVFTGIVNVVVLAASLTIAPQPHFGRYVFPVLAATLIFVLHRVLVRFDDEPSTSGLDRSRVLVTGAAVAIIGVFVWVGFAGPSPTPDLQSLDQARLIVDLARREDLDKKLTPTVVLAKYERAMEAVPDHARVIVEVDEPDALYAAGHVVDSLDIPGWAAPDGDFPFFTGPNDKVATLRKAGYDLLITTDSNDHLCFNRSIRRAQSRTGLAADRLLLPYTNDFFDDVDALVKRYPGAVRRVGNLYLIDLRKIPGTDPGGSVG